MNEPTIDALLRKLVRDAVRDSVRIAIREELGASAAGTPAPRNGDDVYLSVANAGRIADVAPGTIRAWIRNGRLSAKRAGRVLRVSRAELERFMSGAPNKAEQAEIRQRATKLRDRARKPLHPAAA